MDFTQTGLVKYSNIETFHVVLNRPGVAGAVLSKASFSDWLKICIQNIWNLTMPKYLKLVGWNFRICVCLSLCHWQPLSIRDYKLYDSKLDGIGPVDKKTLHRHASSPCLETSLLRRLQAENLSDEAPPIGKIHPFSKMAVTFKPLIGFWCPSGFRKLLITVK